MTTRIIKTDRCIQKYKPQAKEYFVKVAGCKKLSLRVRPNTNNSQNRKSWIYRYNSLIDGKDTKLSLGQYPMVSLAQAKGQWFEIEKQIQSEQDPYQLREQEKKEKENAIKYTFEYFAWAHYESIKGSQKESTLKRKHGRYELLCDYIGKEPIDSITPPRMLDVLLDIQKNSLNAKGKPTDKAERCAGIASEIFIYASARGFCASNPAQLIKSQLAKYQYGHRPAITAPADFAEMMNKIDNHQADINTINSLRLLALLFVRNGDLRRVKWTDLDLDAGKWYLKPMKGEGKLIMVKDMVIPLSRQAVDIFKEQQLINGNREYVFFSDTASKNNIISENTANDRLKELGYKDKHCPHGFRSSAKTMLQERLKYQAVYVEMALGHVTKDQNGTAYGRFEFLDDRTEMMQSWADWLDKIKLEAK